MTRTLTITTLVGLALPIQAALLAHYDFTDGILTNNEVGPAETLTLINQGANIITTTPQGSASFPGETGADADYLELDRSGAGAGAFTVSIWFKTGTVDQGSFQGIFSNNVVNNPNNFSWQIDVNGGIVRLVSATSGFPAITNGDAGEPAIIPDVWNQIVARKTGGSTADLWLGTETTPLQSLGTANMNPGGLQYFRLGVNRNSDSLYEMEMANVKIYDDANVSLTDLNAEGPQLLAVPEPTTGLLVLLSLPLLLRRKK